jgi:hypothetical protein
MDNIAVSDEPVAADELPSVEADEAAPEPASADYGKLFDDVEKQLDELSALSVSVGRCRSDQERVEVLCKYVLSSQLYAENTYKLLVEMNNILVDKIEKEN